MSRLEGVDSDLALASRESLGTSIARHRLLSAAQTWHEAQRHPGVLVLDAGVFGAIVQASTSSTTAAVLTGIGFLVAGLASGLYQRRSVVETQGVVFFVRPLIPTVIATTGLLVAVGLPRVSGTQIVATSGAAFAMLVATRVVLWMVLSRERRHGSCLRRTLVIGTGPRVGQIVHRLGTYPEAGLHLTAVHLTDSEAPLDDATLSLLLEDLSIRHVLLATDGADDSVLHRAIRVGKGRVDLSLVLPLSGLASPHMRVRIGDLGVFPLRLVPSQGSAVAKRVMDIFASALLLVLLSPIIGAAAALVRLTSGRPVIFGQSRVGQGGRCFTIYKLRSMVPGANDTGDGPPVAGDPRVTRVGAVIRKYSIDELPQLINVLKGNMSLVGPRPLPVSPQEFTPDAHLRHVVAPGITGLWQVLGVHLRPLLEQGPGALDDVTALWRVRDSNTAGYGDMLDVDLAYLTSHTIGMDLQLLLRTLPALIVRRATY